MVLAYRLASSLLCRAKIAVELRYLPAVSPLNRDSARRIAVKRRYFDGPARRIAVQPRFFGWQHASFQQFVIVWWLARLVLTSVEYRFKGGIIKLPGDAKASPDSPLSSYLNGWSY